MGKAVTMVRGFVLAVLLCMPVLAGAQELAGGSEPDAFDPDAVETSPVILDGRTLLNVRGIRAYPAPRRARNIERRIRAAAADRSFVPDSIRLNEGPHGTDIGYRRYRLMRVTDADAEMEAIDRHVLAELAAVKIREAIVAWRAARTRHALTTAAGQAAIATVVALLPFLLLRWLLRFITALEMRHASRVKGVHIRSVEVLTPARIWAVLRGLLRFVVAVLLVAVVFLWAQYVMGLFPWTWGLAAGLRGWVVAPLEFAVRGFVAMIPNLIFIGAMVLIVRYALRLMQQFFLTVGRGEVTLPNFYPEWAAPTFNILRLVVVAFTLVVAYPYIPGAGSEAFKGLSIFVAAMFSLSSTSVLSNIIAGYALIYRRVFREGDLVKVGEVIGFVTRTRLQVTHLRTPKNEEVIVPNSTILTSNVINYHKLAADSGLILHTSGGIGYETPWRQVEAMLIEAAARTPGLLTEPRPFVLQTQLGDFAVSYQINAYCQTPGEMMRIYSALHGNILDVFNEHRVQIMTPAYEGDPAEPKVVPRERWHLAPASVAGPPD
jgi:small-conductance mechanosensitive channel